MQLNRLIEKNYGNGNSKYIDDINIRYKHPDHGSEKAKSQGLKRKRGRIYCIEKKKKKKEEFSIQANAHIHFFPRITASTNEIEFPCKESGVKFSTGSWKRFEKKEDHSVFRIPSTPTRGNVVRSRTRRLRYS